MRLSYEDIARQSCAMVPRWRLFGDFLGPAFPASRAQHFSDLHYITFVFNVIKFLYKLFFLLIFHYCATIYGEIKVFKFTLGPHHVTKYMVDIRPLRLGNEKKKVDERRNHRAKI